MEELSVIIKKLTSIEEVLSGTTQQINSIMDSIESQGKRLDEHEANIRRLEKLVDRREPEYAGEQEKRIEFTIKF
jgi:peptidoglycan hydrolase CwlO-like protein